MLNGYRNGIMVMRDIAEMLEKNPNLPVPNVRFNGAKREQIECAIVFNVWGSADYNILNRVERADFKRRSIEKDMQAIMAALGEGIEWTANDPSADNDYDRSYFIMTGERDGVTVKMLCNRADVGETVTVAQAGPDVTEVDGAVRVIRQTATMWRPNITLTRAAPVTFELPSGEIKQLSA